MPNWNCQIDIKQYLEDDDLTLEERRDGILLELDRIPTRLRTDTIDWTYRDAMEAFDEAVEFDDEDAFDNGLDHLYDWADENRVWLG